MTATASYNNSDASASVTVYANELTGISVAPVSVSVLKDATITLTASLTKTDYGEATALTNPTVSWSSGSTSYVTVSPATSHRSLNATICMMIAAAQHTNIIPNAEFPIFNAFSFARIELKEKVMKTAQEIQGARRHRRLKHLLLHPLKKPQLRRPAQTRSLLRRKKPRQRQRTPQVSPLSFRRMTKHMPQQSQSSTMILHSGLR